VVWPPYREFARQFKTHSEDILAAFAAFTISVEVVLWAIGITVGFAAIYWTVPNDFAWDHAPHDFLDAFYYSASTLTTLGYGDITASEPLTKVLSFCEVLAGLATVSLVIAFIPSLFSGFTGREAPLARLNTGRTMELSDVQLLQYWFGMGGWDATKADLSGFLAECDFWINWTTGLLESHAAHPILAYFRSRHYSMHWLLAIRTLIDAATLACATMPAVASRHPSALRLALSRTLNQINGRLGGGRDRQANVDRATFDIAYRALQASHPALLRPPDEAWRLYYDFHLEYEAQVKFLFDYLMVPKTILAPARVA
jgi:hypothetical protein